jgi:hypothetical protein
LESPLGSERIVLCALWLCAATTAAVPQHQQQMTDQLFGVSYDPQKVHFDKMPAALADKCPGLRHRYVNAWVYGHFKTHESEYFLISGLMEFHRERGGPTIAPEEGDGLIVAVQDSKCLLDEAGYFLTQTVNTGKGATPIMVPSSVLTGILRDAFERYSVAFGGKQEFLKRVRRNGALPVVQEQLNTFEKSPNE